MSRAERSLVFLHLPKAAGSTLRGVIVRQYPAEATHTIRVPIWPAIDEFRAWPEDRRHAVRLLIGHMAFGLHELLRPPVAYVTMVREPVDRVLSHFHFVRGRPKHELHDRVRPDMTVGEYVREQTSLELDNGQVRLLSGDPFVPFGAVTRDHLEASKRHLRDHFAVTAVSERFDEGLIVMQRTLGWRRRILYVSRNVTREPRAPVSPEDLEAVRSANRWDAELHAFAAETFARQAAERVPDLTRRLARFRAANRWYNRVARVAIPVRDRVAGPRRAALSSR